MAEDGKVSTDRPRDVPDDRTVDVARVIEQNKTIRLAIVCGTIILGLAIIAVAAVNLMKPSWETILLAVFAPGGTAVVAIQVTIRAMLKARQQRESEKVTALNASESVQAIEPLKQIEKASASTDKGVQQISQERK